MSRKTIRWVAFAVLIVGGVGVFVAARPASGKSPLARVLDDYAQAGRSDACDPQLWLERLLDVIDASPDDPLKPAGLDLAHALACRAGDHALAADLAVRMIQSARDEFAQCQYHELLAQALDQQAQTAPTAAERAAARGKAIAQWQALFREVTQLLRGKPDGERAEILAGIAYTTTKRLAEAQASAPGGPAKVFETLRTGRKLLMRCAPGAGFASLGISYAEALAFAELDHVLRWRDGRSEALRDILKDIAGLRQRMLEPSEYLRYVMSTGVTGRRQLVRQWLESMPPDAGTAELKVEYASSVLGFGDDTIERVVSLLRGVYERERPQLARLAQIVAARTAAGEDARKKAERLKAAYDGLLLQALVRAELAAGHRENAERYAAELSSLYPASVYEVGAKRALSATCR